MNVAFNCWPEESCSLNSQVYLARGKVLGGSSATNATLYMRGTRSDYDSWGMSGWGAKEALYGFIKCEDNGNGNALFCN